MLYYGENEMLEIRKTSAENIRDVQRLWADGDVMRFVGFPEGLHKTDAEMADWLRWIESGRPLIEHYSIFDDGFYCGEAFYNIDTEHFGSCSLDIKLFAFARGRGIASKALSFAMKEAFKNGARSVWVDPDPANAKAIALYKRLGFKEKKRPEFLPLYEGFESAVYMEVARDDLLTTVFESERIRFVRLSDLLLKDYLAMVNDMERVGSLIGRTEQISEEQELDWVRLKIEENGPIFSMIEKDTGDFIGNIEYMDAHKTEGELGIAITADKQDKGFGKEAITRFFDYGAGELGLGRVFLKAFRRNKRAIHVYERCGFREYKGYAKELYMERFL